MPPTKNPWFDDECRQAHSAKQAAYKATLDRRTRAVRELYELKRREEHRLLKRKKKEHEKRAIEEMERCYGRNDVRKFYQRIKQLSNGYKLRTEACRNEEGQLVVESQSILRIWKDHFCRLLNGEEDTNTAVRQNVPPHTMDDDRREFRPPDLDEVKIAISRLKSNKAAGADGLSAELFKAAGDELVRYMHQLICKIWSEESMPDEWNLSIVCPIHKKGDPLQLRQLQRN
jgi:hypothetical protein